MPRVWHGDGVYPVTISIALAVSARAIKENVGEIHVFTWGDLRYSKCRKSQLQNNNYGKILFLKRKIYKNMYHKHSERKYTKC